VQNVEQEFAKHILPLLKNGDLCKKKLGIDNILSNVKSKKNLGVLVTKENDGNIFGFCVVKLQHKKLLPQLYIDTLCCNKKGFGVCLIKYVENICILNNIRILQLEALDEIIGLYLEKYNFSFIPVDTYELDPEIFERNRKINLAHFKEMKFVEGSEKIMLLTMFLEKNNYETRCKESKSYNYHKKLYSFLNLTMKHKEVDQDVINLVMSTMDYFGVYNLKCMKKGSFEQYKLIVDKEGVGSPVENTKKIKI
jgi:hypothetical protein